MPICGPRLEEPARQIVGIVGDVHDDAPNRIVAAPWIIIARHQLTRSPFPTSFLVATNRDGTVHIRATGTTPRRLLAVTTPTWRTGGVELADDKTRANVTHLVLCRGGFGAGF